VRDDQGHGADVLGLAAQFGELVPASGRQVVGESGDSYADGVGVVRTQPD
jgi:hypothetical protein